jgi:glyoxylase-like metal-dependent hydrolase (beta-lactamase superfamily II)
MRMEKRMKTGAILLAAAGLLLSAPQSWAQDLGPHFKKIKDGIFTYAGKPQQSNCTIILTQEGVVLIDSGDAPTDSQAVLKAVKQLTVLPVRILINTEPHADHTTGHFVFSPPAVIVAAAGATASMKGAYNPQRLAKLMEESAEMRAAAQGHRLVTPQVEYRDKMTLNLGERTFELTYLKNVHSESDTSIWMPKERVLFTAASVGVKRVNNLRPTTSIPDTLSAIKMMRAHNPEVVIPGHGEPGTVAILDTMERYYTLLLERTKQMMAQGKTLDQIKKELKMPEAADWDGQERFDTNVEAAYRALKG